MTREHGPGSFRMAKDRDLISMGFYGPIKSLGDRGVLTVFCFKCNRKLAGSEKNFTKIGTCHEILCPLAISDAASYCTEMLCAPGRAPRILSHASRCRTNWFE